MHKTPVRHSLWTLFSPAARAARRDEGGFSVIEVAIAIGVFAVVGAFTSQLLGAGFKGVLLGKRREVATQEANRLIEIARSLSYDAIGLVATDSTLAGDTAIEEHEGAQTYRSADVWEPLIFANNPTGHPFNPHIKSISRAATKLTDYIYVTGVDADEDGTIDMKRVSVRVAWESSGTAGPKNEVRAQTLVDQSGTDLTAGSGGDDDDASCVTNCVTGRTPLKAKAFGTGGSLEIESSILGLTNPLTIGLPQTTGTSKYRAVSDASCTAKSTAVQALSVIDLPGSSIATNADDDARTATASDPAAVNAGGALTLTGIVSGILGATINSPIACDATMSPLPAEEGSATALTSTLTASTNVTALGGLLDWLLTIASVQTAPVTQSIEQEVVSNQREIAASASGSFGTVQLLKIPSLFSNGLIQVDGLSYGASVRGAAGTPSAAPAITSPNFTVRVFDNGNLLGASCSGAQKTGITATRSGSYCVITVNTSASGYSGGSISITHNFTHLIGLNIVNLSYSVNLDFLPAAKSPIAGVEGSNGEKRWSAEYTPVAASATLDASVLGTPLIDTDVNFNLGGVSTNACAGATCI